MTPILLRHHPRLAYPAPPGRWPADGAVPASAAVVSFRPPAAGKAAVRDGLTATSRLLDLGADHLAFYGVETDSPLAPLLLWDAAHALPVGGTVTLAGDPGVEPYLGREYFRPGLTAEARTPAGTTFRKTAELPAERDRGLNRWTFGIPTGPGDATGLNACVQRILELGLDEFEVVLCGRPGPGFRYFDRVRIVGEELSAPPVRIGLKKNVLADEARYENLCLLHDRVFLPTSFRAAVERFGDLYPLACFQSLWVDDPYNLIPRRYSDYGRITRPLPMAGLTGPDPVTDLYRPELLAELERTLVTVYASPLRYHPHCYCTGSLYLAKRAVWRACPQDPRLLWSQYEDVEHGLRASAAGVPARVNPFAFTQSLFARALLTGEGAMYETATGRAIWSVSPFQMTGVRRKPLHKVSAADAAGRLRAFALKWVPAHHRAAFPAGVGQPPADTPGWLRQVAAVVYAAAVPATAAGVTAFVADVEKQLICDTVDNGFKRFVLESIAVRGPAGRDTLVEGNGHFVNALFQRPAGGLFYHTLADYFPTRGAAARLGTRVSAARMARHDGATLHHPDGRAGYQSAIWDSTPFREYYQPEPS